MLEQNCCTEFLVHQSTRAYFITCMYFMHVAFSLQKQNLRLCLCSLQMDQMEIMRFTAAEFTALMCWQFLTCSTMTVDLTIVAFLPTAQIMSTRTASASSYLSIVKGISTLEANLLSVEVILKMIVELIYTDDLSQWFQNFLCVLDYLMCEERLGFLSSKHYHYLTVLNSLVEPNCFAVV